MKPLIVTGTDTDVGKTFVAAMLTLGLGGIYWKPIQSGTKDGTDRERVATLTGLEQEYFRPEQYVFGEPLSPHRAAELDDAIIDLRTLALPTDIPADRHLIMEGAGGVLVPITRFVLQIELFATWNAPIVVVTRTTLGTINHTLLTLEALRQRALPILGVIFVGDAAPDNERTIVEMGATRKLGRLPFLPHPDRKSLTEAFNANFIAGDFETVHEQ